jgi:hypothetical protein
MITSSYLERLGKAERERLRELSGRREIPYCDALPGPSIRLIDDWHVVKHRLGR